MAPRLGLRPTRPAGRWVWRDTSVGQPGGFPQETRDCGSSSPLGRSKQRVRRGGRRLARPGERGTAALSMPASAGANSMHLFERFASSLSRSDPAVPVVRDYSHWQAHRRGAPFTPSADDDVDVRTYLFDLRGKDADPAALQGHVAALKRFYQWAHTEGVIAHNPFDDYDFDRPFLTSENIT